METNLRNHGVLTEGGVGIGEVGRKMIRERAAEIEAAHDQLLPAARAAKTPEEPSP